MSEVNLESIRRIIREELQASGVVSDLITVAQAAALVSCGVGTVRIWLREGLLTRQGKGRNIRVSRRELLELMARQPAESPLTDADIEAKAARMLRDS
jgi:excisionase family DNA binding protein